MVQLACKINDHGLSSYISTFLPFVGRKARYMYIYLRDNQSETGSISDWSTVLFLLAED